MTSVPTWLREGLRSAFFLPPRTAGRRVRPRELVAIAVLSAAFQLFVEWAAMAGPADFNLRGWLLSWWSTAILALLLWALLPEDEAREGRPVAGVASWFALWLVATVPPTLVSYTLGALQDRELLPAAWSESTLVAWGIYLGIFAWAVAVAVRLGAHAGLARGRQAVLGTVLTATFALSVWQFPDTAWEERAEPYVPPPRLALSEETFEAQQALFQRSVAALAPERPGVADVYALVFAPYAQEDVFLREGRMVADVLAQRFDAQGRVLHLANHVDAVDSLPWATPRNLKRAVAALGERMDREQDLLVVYLTSHGARDFKLAAAHPPLEVAPVSPGELRVALDEAGIRHRVIAVSACYSGGWVGPLAGDTTLVMTAADPDRTSFGCGRRSDLTFFGRALFDEQLRRTHSFEQAFAAAVPVIRQREVDAGKPDGFSNPQISVGERIRPVLKAIEQRLETP